MPLRFGKKAEPTTNGTNGAPNGTVPLALNGKRKEISAEPTKPAGVGFVDSSDNLEDPIITGEDDELINEDDLITKEDLARPIIQRE